MRCLSSTIQRVECKLSGTLSDSVHVFAVSIGGLTALGQAYGCSLWGMSVCEWNVLRDADCSEVSRSAASRCLWPDLGRLASWCHCTVLQDYFGAWSLTGRGSTLTMLCASDTTQRPDARASSRPSHPAKELQSSRYKHHGSPLPSGSCQACMPSLGAQSRPSSSAP